MEYIHHRVDRQRCQDPMPMIGQSQEQVLFAETFSPVHIKTLN